MRNLRDDVEVLEGYVVSSWANAPAVLQPSEGWMDCGNGYFFIYKFNLKIIH